MEKQILNAIEEAVKNHMKERWAYHMQHLEKEREDFIAAVGLQIARKVELTRSGDTIQISFSVKG